MDGPKRGVETAKLHKTPYGVSTSYILTVFRWDNTIRMARNVAPVTGNTKGKQQKRHVSWSIVDHTPLSKRVSAKGVKQ